MKTWLCAILMTAPMVLAGGAQAATAAKPAAAKPAAAAPVPDPKADAEAAASQEAFEQAMSALRVADFARRQKDPQAMIVAARMLQEIPFQDQAPAADPNAAADAGSTPAPFSAEGLFGEARKLANGDQTLLMQINVAEGSGSRGVLTSAFGKGLVRIVQSVSARATYVFAISAKAGELLRIGAIGDINTQIVMRLLDAKGRVACQDDNADYAPVCSIKPSALTDYKVEILNRSATPTRAVILSN